jgi:aryl-alcohol dehydrogenase-like predicted oxidoreductase
MEYRQLGGSGVRVSAIGLGGNTFGRYCDEAQTRDIIHRALDLGVNHIDTADLYSRGVSEEFVGRALVDRRDQVVLATKVGFPWGEGPNDQGLSSRRVIAACEESLDRLGVDYVDLYYLHRPDPLTPLEETLRAFDHLVRDGKVRYVGISNHAAWQVADSLWICDTRGYSAPVVSQNAYNLLDRGVEKELLPFCRSHKVGLVPYSPIAGGFLTGKYRRDAPIEPGVRGYNNAGFGRQLNARNFDLLERLTRFAEDRGHTVGELAVAWLLSHSEVCSVICGATNPEQVEENVRAGDWRLDEEDLVELDLALGEDR